jgi:adenylosuccinate synthase
VAGWDADITGVRRWEDLPAEAQQYIRRVAEIGGAPVSLVSVGPERDQIIVCPA